MAAPELQLPPETVSAEDLLVWAHEQFGDRLCITCSWQKQSSVLVHMISALGLPVDVIELDTQLFFRESYETRDRLVERYGLNLILRDELAIDRTLLANERTLMAYLRSAVSLVIAGVTILHFSSVGWFWAVGLACIPAGVIVGLVGVARYVAMGRKIGAIKSRSKARGTTAVE